MTLSQPLEILMHFTPHNCQLYPGIIAGFCEEVTVRGLTIRIEALKGNILYELTADRQDVRLECRNPKTGCILEIKGRVLWTRRQVSDRHRAQDIHFIGILLDSKNAMVQVLRAWLTEH
jgi:hypothetical protein